MKYNPAQIAALPPEVPSVTPREERRIREHIAHDVAKLLVHTATFDDVVAYKQAYDALRDARKAFITLRRKLAGDIAERKF